MTEQASPRGTFLEIAAALRARVASDPEMAELPRVADLMRDHSVSRGVVLRAFGVLREEGIAEHVPGGRWRVVREKQKGDRRPLEDRIADVIEQEQLEVGKPFLSASALADRFGVSRPTVTKALDRLEAAGVLASAGQGRVRTIRTLPKQERCS